MASKQLGKFKQWAGEVIAVRDKTVVTDEFRELEHDIELRRRGLYKLHLASEDYQCAVAKKKESEVVDGDEKLLSIDALGCVMIQHGEEFGEDSAFGTSLVNLGRAHCQVAALQEAFALQFDDTFLASIRRAEDEIKEYQAQRKKLESRRLSYDAAITKAEKIRNGKKEKEKDILEAEDGLEKAKSRYEEMLEDVRARMYAIQENELDLLRALTAFLNDEVHFVEQYLEVLKEARAGWIDEATLTQMDSAKRKRPPPRPVADSRVGSVRSMKSVSKHSLAESPPDSDSNEDTHPKESRISRALSLRKSDSGSHSHGNVSRPRSRANSTTTVGSISEKDKDKDKEKEKEKEKKRQSVAGWATSKVSSLAHRGKKDKAKSKSKADVHDLLASIRLP
ncbi:hypothetical protein NM688_g6235 [Phlebia brevispora]|uniref:Uncharacterized protein n=1 Tax=Phlebia brevispora TaxID=194682 RepID=A0ACC1SIH4_9APHY|nr:hypothetical protein NM688_g6235 [Phlebia brevispora]